MAAIWICPAAWAAWEVENKMVLMITKPALQKAGFFSGQAASGRRA